MECLTVLGAFLAFIGLLIAGKAIIDFWNINMADEESYYHDDEDNG